MKDNLSLNLEDFSGTNIAKGFIDNNLEKGRSLPVGSINKYGEMKMPDGSWKWVKKEKKQEVNKTTIETTLKTNLPLVDEVLSKVKPLTEKIVEDVKKKTEEKGEKFTERDQKYLELVLVHNLVKSLGKYTKSTDIPKDLNSSVHKGSIEISGKIERDGQEYPFRTESIYAGGHSIQSLHIRYITKTTLPQSEESKSVEKELSDKIAKLSKQQKLEKEIEYYKKRVASEEAKSKELDSKTQEQVLQDDKLLQEYIEQGRKPERFKGKDLPGSVHESEETWNNFIQEIKDSTLSSHENSKRISKMHLKTLSNELTKLQKKLNDL